MPSMFEQAMAMEAEERRQAKRGYVSIESYQALQARCDKLEAAARDVCNIAVSECDFYTVGGYQIDALRSVVNGGE